jgi:transposase
MAKRAKRDFDELQKRRMRAANMLRRGVPQAEVVRRVGVTPAAVCKWNRVLEANRQPALRKAGRAGRKPKLDASGLARVRERLKAGALAAGYGTDLWTLKRVSKLIEQQCRVRYSESEVWHVLTHLGFSCQRPSARAIQRDEQAISDWKRKTWPALKINARRLGQTIVFIDETGVCERAHRVRTWAPRG